MEKVSPSYEQKRTPRKKRPIPVKLRFHILERDSHRCAYCGATAPEVKLHVDHIVPADLGGTEEEDNLVTACSDCNVGKHTRLSTHTLDTTSKDINDLVQTALAKKEKTIQDQILIIKEKNQQIARLKSRTPIEIPLPSWKESFLLKQLESEQKARQEYLEKWVEELNESRKYFNLWLEEINKHRKGKQHERK